MMLDIEIAKQHLREYDDFADEIIMRNLSQAEAIVLKHLKVFDGRWDLDNSEAEELPADIEAAVLLVVQALFEGTEPITSAVRALLNGHRDPSLA